MTLENKKCLKSNNVDELLLHRNNLFFQFERVYSFLPTVLEKSVIPPVSDVVSESCVGWAGLNWMFCVIARAMAALPVYQPCPAKAARRVAETSREGPMMQQDQSAGRAEQSISGRFADAAVEARFVAGERHARTGHMRLFAGFLAAMLIGQIHNLGIVYLPEVASAIPFILMIAVLVWRPSGFSGKSA